MHLFFFLIKCFQYVLVTFAGQSFDILSTKRRVTKRILTLRRGSIKLFKIFIALQTDHYKTQVYQYIAAHFQSRLSNLFEGTESLIKVIYLECLPRVQYRTMTNRTAAASTAASRASRAGR